MNVIIIREKPGFNLESTFHPGRTYVDSMWLYLEAEGTFSNDDARKYLSGKGYTPPNAIEPQGTLPWKNAKGKRAWIVPLHTPVIPTN